MQGMGYKWTNIIFLKNHSNWAYRNIYKSSIKCFWKCQKLSKMRPTTEALTVADDKNFLIVLYSGGKTKETAYLLKGLGRKRQNFWLCMFKVHTQPIGVIRSSKEGLVLGKGFVCCPWLAKVSVGGWGLASPVALFPLWAVSFTAFAFLISDFSLQFLVLVHSVSSSMTTVWSGQILICQFKGYIWRR